MEMEDGDEGRRRLQGRRLILSQPRARGALLLTLADLFITFLFAVLPDNREAEGSQQEAIFVAQKVFAWFNFVISGVCVGVIWYTFGVPVASLNTERQLTLWYAIVLQLLQMLLDMALAGYPTGMRQLLVIVSLVLRTVEVFYFLFLARETLLRPVRPPLVIKALLDMKGDSHLGAEPLTLGMLERLEGIVKVRDQAKFHTKNGRQTLTLAMLILLIFSMLIFGWEFTKIFTYQSRYFSDDALSEMTQKSQMPMYWPSRAYDARTAAPSDVWVYHEGSTATCEGCEFPRTGTNAKPKPLPTGTQRVVLVVLGGLSAEQEYTDFLRFRHRAGWADDAVEMLMRVQLPTNAVPNWLATTTGLTPDLVGALGNRNLGTTAVDNIFRRMKSFEDHWECDRDPSCQPKPYAAAVSVSAWFTGLIKTDLPYLIGDGSTSYVANEDESFDRSEVHKWKSDENDEDRAEVAHLALQGDAQTAYHFFMLHFTDIDSQGARHGKSDFWNSFNMNSSYSTPAEVPWDYYIPEDVIGSDWRANSYKRAIARKGDIVDDLMDKYSEDTLFLVVGDHGHVEPGGAGGASEDVRIVPFFAYKKDSGLGARWKAARRESGSTEADSARFVSRTRRIDEFFEPPDVTPNDKCDIMDESSGSDHTNTCDEWRADGEYTIENIDIAPTVMALLGLPVPRHSLGVFIDDIVGSIGSGDAAGSLLGANCSVAEEAAEGGTAERLRQDRMCPVSYGPNEDPALPVANSPWSSEAFQRYRHTLHFRDLFQQKLAFVRGYLKATGRLDVWKDKGFMKTVEDGAAYYNEGADGRCAAYDPFNRMEDAQPNDPLLGAHVYTIQPVEYGRCAACGAFEKRFLTGEELTVRDMLVCQSNDWNRVKQYYIQGIKGLLVVYNREVRYQMRSIGLRNHALTMALLSVVLCIIFFTVTQTTLADLGQLIRPFRGEEYMQRYFARADVRAALWAFCSVMAYYLATILLYFLLQNILGYRYWDASIAYAPESIMVYVFIAIVPAYCVARIVRGVYMYKYRFIEQLEDAPRSRLPMLCSPVRSFRFLTTFFAGNARTCDIAMVYLIRIYFVLTSSVALVIIAVLHCQYSFVIPFVYRMVHVDEANWVFRFRLITVHMMSFPLWIDAWWMLATIPKMYVDGVSVSQLYRMRSEKEERRAGGFPPEDEQASFTANAGGPGAGAACAMSPHTCTRRSVGGAALTTSSGNPRDVDRRLAEAELDRTLCMNRIKQLEEELESVHEAKTEAVAESKLNSAFISRGFGDLSVLLESGFKQLERFYSEKGAQIGDESVPLAGPGGAGGGGGGGTSLWQRAREGVGVRAPQQGARMLSAIEETMSNLRSENDAVAQRKQAVVDALDALGSPKGGGSSSAQGPSAGGGKGGSGNEDDGFYMSHGDLIAEKLKEAKQTKDELVRTERLRDELLQQVSQLEREALVTADEREKLNDDLAGVQAERDLLERKVNELRRELHAKNKEIEHLEAELKLSKSQQVRAMAKLSVQKSKAEKTLTAMQTQLKKVGEDKAALFGEVSSLESQLAQAHADREEARVWANTYREMLVKVA